MLIIITLLGLPIIIKLFTTWGILKLRALPVKNISAEMVVEQMNSKKTRSLKVEEAYNIIYKNFHDKLRAGELTRERIIAIREYLSRNVNQYPKKKFKNDAHAIYTMLKAKDISRRDLAIVQKIIA
ncbi:hypothetical protein SR42_15090 [Clostridium botulinum]|uniref:hypothetical protein n=1 Tax=Clostridium botulinum TaxID=1491 RepID=UPI0005972208|nr:hypothetical protein [Clostridium botulinum]KIL06895.1 hypothetical protein SR42_15090 [Clostridium botulinum]MBY6935314.1 hypothetical protein [Clostridium botulinum]NFL82056.1 hypothetical protein [Clostridium botulinum]NFN13190.1 hypothetical protein [Clostridium botulinum]NFO38201.1 hypothetical protein [Clostridium botulinum]